MITEWYQNLSNATRAAVATAFFSFITVLGTSLIGLLGSVQEWLDGGEAPDLTFWGKIVLSGAIAAGTGLVNYAVRAFQQHQDPEAGPHYPS